MTEKNHETDVAFIKALAELLRDNDLTELEVTRVYDEDDSLNVRVSRQTIVAPAAAPVAVAAPMTAAPAAAPTATAPSEEATDDPAAHPGAVTSPIVGTIYMQAEPGAPAFISV
ncbi:MAG: acetyl-CoA carboxylase, biotin carboxyl carrier protein, partial [Paracoccaceae bacterium]